MKRGAIIVEAVVVVTLCLLVVVSGIGILSGLGRRMAAYYAEQEETFEAAFGRSVEVIRFEKSLMDGQ